MTKTLTLKEARSQFSDIVDRAARLSERVVVTKNGRPKVRLKTSKIVKIPRENE